MIQLKRKRKNSIYTSAEFKSQVIDKIYLVAIICGTLAGIGSFVLDINYHLVGIPVSIKRAMHLIALLGLVLLYTYRGQIPLRLKSTIIALLFLSISTTLLYIFGVNFSAFALMGVAVFVVVITYDYTTSGIIIVIISFIIPLVGYLSSNQFNEPQIDANIVLGTGLNWIISFLTFLFFAIVAILGIGRYNKFLTDNYEELSLSKQNLEHIIEELNIQMQQKKTFEKELLVTQKKIRGVFDASIEGILLFDENANIIEMNQAITNIIGFERKDLINRNLVDVAKPQTAEIVLNRFKALASGELQPLLELDLQRKDSTKVTVEVSSNLIVADDQVMVITSMRDISYRKAHEYEKYNAALDAQERERERLARDLHDDLGPAFSTIKMYLQSLHKQEVDEEKRNNIGQLIEMINDGIGRIREISHDLSPYLLRNKGLVEAVRHHLQKIKSTGTLDSTLNIRNETDFQIPDKQQIVLYRTFQELLNNTIKHAFATKVEINIGVEENNLYFIYKDDGHGFNHESVRNTSEGIGLKNIIHRIKATGGSIDFIKSEHSMSTIIAIPV